MLNQPLMRFVLIALLLSLSSNSLSVEKDANPKTDKKKLINFQISSPHKSHTYSCDLIKYSNQCREYEILASAKATLDELTDGCQSMGGTFQKLDCPNEKYLASCVDIVRNYHRPDVIYSNLYYSGKPVQWNVETIERVCGDLGGEVE